MNESTLNILSDNELTHAYMCSDNPVIKLLAERLDAILQSERDAQRKIKELDEDIELRDQQEASLHETIESLEFEIKALTSSQNKKSE